MSNPKIWVGCDHAGFALKEQLLKKFPAVEWHDEGTFSDASVDYPDFADRVVRALEREPSGLGLLICGSGEGMVIRANRAPWVRAVLCWNTESAALSRAHNNANVLCLAARLVDAETNERILSVFLATAFEGGRHVQRVEKLGRSLT